MTDADTIDDVIYNVTYKGEPGTLLFSDKVFHYQANGDSKTSVKCSWARVEKRQLSPASSSPVHMMKLILVSGKSAVFDVTDRETLEELRTDAQARMDRAAEQSQRRRQSVSEPAGLQDPSFRDVDTTHRQWVDEPTPTPHHKRRRSSTSGSRNGDACGWCCIGSLVCWLCVCLICILLAVAAVLIYWFVVKDNEDELLSSVGIGDAPRNTSQPPDYGNEARYGIRSVYHDWNQEEMTLNYKLSDYILDSSISYKLYDGLDCRRSANDITRTNDYLFMELILPQDGGANLGNQGRGSRNVDLHFTLNKGQITSAPFFFPNGLERARLNFCIGLLVHYNRVEYWNKEEEVRCWKAWMNDAFLLFLL